MFSSILYKWVQLSMVSSKSQAGLCPSKMRILIVILTLDSAKRIHEGKFYTNLKSNNTCTTFSSQIMILLALSSISTG